MRQFLCMLAGLMVVAGCAQKMWGQHGALAAPQALTVDYLQDPVGLDHAAPRLSWKLIAARRSARDLRQVAYQILVASSPERLRDNQGDLWDSGRVVSDQSLNVVYVGKPLVTSQRCYWKVRVWDNQSDAPTAWSATGRWIMGVMRPNDWQARWIGANAATRPDCDLAGAQWIWTGDAPSLEQAAQGVRYFRRVFDAPRGAQDAPVLLALTADDEYEVFINGKRAAKTWGHFNESRWMRFQDVSALIKPGRNLIAATVKNKAPGPTALLAVLKFADGQAVPTDTTWSSSAQAVDGWKEKADGFAHDAWKAAVIAGPVDGAPWGKIERRRELVSPAFEKRFTVTRPVREATLHITGLGFYEASLNGQRIGRKVLDPVPTRYDRRVLYSTYDMTERLTRGENRLHVLLGHGWYDVRSVAVWNFDNAPWRDFPRMLAQLEITYDDGTRTMVVSDDTWRQVASPIGFDCIREGEVIGKAPKGAPNLEKQVVRADVVPAPAGRLTASALPPSVVTQRLKPVAVRAITPGTWLVDFGQNTAGWVKLKLAGQRAGDVVTIKYGEKLKEDGSLSLKGTDAHFRYPASFSTLPDGWFQTDRFVCDGSRTQVYEPRFTYNGFQYVQITGVAQPPDASNIEACVVHTDFKDAGRFISSNELLNKLQHAILWAYRGNFVNGYPTDCPHREKNGWTGDASLASELAMYNFQNTAAYEKWIQDLIDEQRPDGNLPGIVPTSGWGYHWGNGPAWDSALVIIPWMLYVYQGDTRILETAYPAMAKYVDYMTSRAKDGIVSHGLGDWIPVKTKTPTEVTSTGYYYLDAQIVARVAERLGKHDDAQKYAALARSIREAYTRHLYKGNGVYSIGSQTAQSCALHQGLVPDAERAAVEARLVEAVQKTRVFPDFGILGSKYVFRALSKAGRTDLAFTMATQEEHPSFGNWIKRGATTFWEDWNEGSSRNHIMFGDLSAWSYQYLGGIRLADSVSTIAVTDDPQAVAFKRFIIAPEPVAGLDWVKAEHDSPYGLIRSEWRRENGVFTLEVEVPANTEATIYLPVKPDAKNVTADVPPIQSDRDRMAFRVGSGCYRFSTNAR
ncbi:MAG TPA: family 78 glycoside hydrolase catalytic domain [Kiritimatiellia bacterium]|nr:family 78 glycoside hydrolase catalytic domain [Kiritimatiellia bacterium]